MLKLNSVAACGVASLTTVMRAAPGVRLVNMHWTVSPSAMLIADTGEPLEHVTSVRSYPGTETCDSE